MPARKNTFATSAPKRGKNAALIVVVVIALLLCALAASYFILDRNGFFNRQAPQMNEPVDMEAYYGENGRIVSVVQADQSTALHTEADAVRNLTGRGFSQFPVTSDFSIDGEYREPEEVSDGSTQLHPIYETNYITRNGDVWVIYEINGQCLANPVSYNMGSGNSAQLIFSERDTVMSYDASGNRFYETLPDESALIIRVIDRIDAETLESLTKGEIDAL
ncbi:MAG: hypothetical protein IK080_08655 [Clostridia bacterium]|nr:hypothetical protein [Clostridia bacterium]